MKNWLSRSFLLAVVLLGTGEFVARQFFSRSLSGRFDYGFHPTAGFQENSDGTVNLVKTGGRPFRPQKFSRVPATNVFRVMVFGHSVPYGYYGNADAPLAEVYSSIIAQQLGQQGIQAEGLNLCINGYGARRVQIVLRQALKYQPSLVILHIDQWSNDDLNDRRRKEFEGWHPKNWPMKLLIVRRLYEVKNERIFGKWLPKPVLDQSGETAQLMNPMKNPSAPDSTMSLDETIKITAQNVAMARSQGVPVILVSQAAKKKSDQGAYILDDSGLNAALEKLTGKGVYLISMQQVIQGTPSWENLFTDHVHLNFAGHKLMASAVVKLINEQHLLLEQK